VQRPSPPSGQRAAGRTAAARTTVALAAVALAALVLLLLLTRPGGGAGPARLDAADRAASPATRGGAAELAPGGAEARATGPSALDDAGPKPPSRVAVAAPRSRTLVVQPRWFDAEPDAPEATLRVRPFEGWSPFELELGPDGAWSFDAERYASTALELVASSKGWSTDGPVVLFPPLPATLELALYRTGAIEVELVGLTEGEAYTVRLDEAIDGHERPSATAGFFSWGSERSIAPHEHDTDGTASERFGGLAEGTYPVSLFRGSTKARDESLLERTVVLVERGRTTTVELALDGARPAPVATLTGRVLKGSTPVAGVELRCSGYADGRLMDETTTSAADGSYALELDGTGTFELRAEPERESGFTVDASAVAVASPVTYHEVQLANAVVHGTVVHETVAQGTGRGLAPSGSDARASGATVTVLLTTSHDTGEPRSNEWRASVALDADGSFRFDDVPPGDYDLMVRVDFARDRLASRRVVVTGPDEVVRADLVVEPSREVEVRVLDEAGQVLPYMEVYWRSNDAARPGWGRLTDTDSNGIARGPVDAEGTVVLFARERNGPGVQPTSAFEQVGQHELDETPDLRCSPGGSLAIGIDAEATPFRVVVASASDGRVPVGGTGAGGHRLFQAVGPLPPGGYDVTACTLDGRVFERRVEVVAGRTTRVALP